MSKSAVWKYFEQLRAEDGCKVATCRICDNPPTLRCAGNTTSGLWAHLKKSHQVEHDGIERKKDSNSVKKSSGGGKGRQPTIQAMLSSRAPYGPGHPKQAQFDKNLKAQFINDCVPFSMADSLQFRKTVTDLDPRIKVKTGRTYSKYVRQDEMFKCSLLMLLHSF